jgi:hypothetical protein
MNKPLKTIAALAVALTALSAHAVSTDWGSHDGIEFGADKVRPGAYSDSFEFSLSQGASLVATAVSNNLGQAFNIDHGMVQLYQATTGPATLIGSFGFDGTTGSTPNSFASLLAGDYFYRVTGTATGHAGGWYSLVSATAAVSAVPEASVRGLLGAGLGMLALVAWRRRRDV